MVSRGQAGPNPTRAATASEVQEVGPAPMHDDGIVGHISGYAMPNISSMLPNYSNSEQEFIFRTFNVGNYDLLKHLPDGIKEQQVMAVRTARMAATRRFLMPALSQPLIRSKPSNQQDLFSTFDYIPSRFSLADELASKERVESEAKRMAVGGREFIPSGNVSLPKYKDNAENSTFPFVGGSYEGADDARLAQTCLDRGGVIVDKPWVHSGTDKLGDQPTKMAAWQMMSDVRKWIAKDWEEVDVTIFENDHDCWVVRIPLDKVDSEQGLLAYMNVFIRCNELVNSYKIHKVVDFWGTTPGDGSMYFVFRPPWVKPDRIATYYALFPEEKNWQTTAAVQDLDRTRSPKKESDFPAHQAATSALSYSTRLNWGTNFLTGTASSAVLGKMKESGP